MSEKINARSTVEEMWRNMITFCDPEVAANREGVQYREMRRAFYSGFMMCLHTVAEIGVQLTEEEGCKALDALNDQIGVFAKDQIAAVLKKKAGDN